MHKYCLDTSGFSNPVLDLPEHIYVSLWPQIYSKIDSGLFCWNVEIGDELQLLTGSLGSCLKKNSKTCCFEVASGDWPWLDYITLVETWQTNFKDYISEYNGGRKNTIGLNDLSIVAFAKTLGLPLISMEKRSPGGQSTKRMRIPDLCDQVSVKHFDFNQFLLAEGIKV
jgi:hypothetical protein